MKGNGTNRKSYLIVGLTLAVLITAAAAAARLSGGLGLGSSGAPGEPQDGARGGAPDWAAVLLADSGQTEGEWDFRRKIIRRDTSIYFWYERSLRALDTETDELRILYEEPCGVTEDYWTENFCGYNDIIYFVAPMDEKGYRGQLKMIRTDGTGLRDLWETHVGSGISAYDGVLYLQDYTQREAFLIGDDGTPGRRLPEEETTDRWIPEGFVEYDQNSYPAPASLQSFGYMLLRPDNGSDEAPRHPQLFICSPPGGTVRKVSSASALDVCALLPDSILLSDYDADTGEQSFFRADLKTGDTAPLAGKLPSIYWNAAVLDYPRLFFCIPVTDWEPAGGGMETGFFRVDLETGETAGLFSAAGPGVERFWWAQDDTSLICGDWMYHLNAGEEGVFWERRNIADRPWVGLQLGSPVRKNQLYGLGRLKTCRGQILDRGQAFARYSTALPRFAEPAPGGNRAEYGADAGCGAPNSTGTPIPGEVPTPALLPGAGQINAFLAARGREFIDDASHSFASMLEEEKLNAMEPDGSEPELLPVINYERTLTFSTITLQDENYLSLWLDGYEYWGGAHGMPWRECHTFDSRTGRPLALSDVVDNSEEEIRTLIKKYTEKLCEQYGEENFWEDVPQYAATDKQFSEVFNLTESGVLIHFTPYEIAPYGDGFWEIEIPYEELRLKRPR